MPQSDPSKTERATPKKREKTREEGNVAKSQEVPKAASTLAGIVILYAWMGTINERIQTIMQTCYSFDSSLDFTAKTALNIINSLAYDLGVMLLPVFLFLFFFLDWACPCGCRWDTSGLPKYSNPSWNDSTR